MIKGTKREADCAASCRVRIDAHQDIAMVSIKLTGGISFHIVSPWWNALWAC